MANRFIAGLLGGSRAVGERAAVAAFEGVASAVTASAERGDDMDDRRCRIGRRPTPLMKVAHETRPFDDEAKRFYPIKVTLKELKSMHGEELDIKAMIDTEAQLRISGQMKEVQGVTDSRPAKKIDVDPLKYNCYLSRDFHAAAIVFEDKDKNPVKEIYIEVAPDNFKWRLARTVRSQVGIFDSNFIPKEYTSLEANLYRHCKKILSGKGGEAVAVAPLLPQKESKDEIATAVVITGASEEKRESKVEETSDVLMINNPIINQTIPIAALVVYLEIMAGSTFEECESFNAELCRLLDAFDYKNGKFHPGYNKIKNAINTYVTSLIKACENGVRTGFKNVDHDKVIEATLAFRDTMAQYAGSKNFTNATLNKIIGLGFLICGVGAALIATSTISLGWIPLFALPAVGSTVLCFFHADPEGPKLAEKVIANLPYHLKIPAC